ncbi:unnamed protein product [Gadus morhua 'NCC']
MLADRRTETKLNAIHHNQYLLHIAVNAIHHNQYLLHIAVNAKHLNQYLLHIPVNTRHLNQYLLHIPVNARHHNQTRSSRADLGGVTAMFCMDPRLPSAPPRPPVCFVLENVTQLCVPVTPGTGWGDR